MYVGAKGEVCNSFQILGSEAWQKSGRNEPSSIPCAGVKENPT